MGYESEEGGVIPTGFESEGAGSDHDAKHGDPYERPAFTNPGAAPGLLGRHGSSRFHPGPKRALRFYRPHRRALHLTTAGASAKGAGAAVFGAGQRLFTPAAHATGQARHRVRATAHALLRTRYCGSPTSFATRYTATDVLLLAHTDSLHGTLFRSRHPAAHGARVGRVRRSAL